MVLILIFLTAFNSCDQERPGISGESIIRGFQNGEVWTAPASGGPYSSDTDNTNAAHNAIRMSGFVLDETKIFSESIVFSNIPFQTGRYVLTNKNSEVSKANSTFYTAIGFDVSNSSFHLDTASGNFIEVEIADSESNYIRGTFEAVYVRDSSDTIYDPYLPDTVRFTNGFFRVKITDPR